MYNLFILARDVDEFNALYKEEVLELVASKGFTRSYNKPLETYQGPQCKYSNFPEPPVDIPSAPFRNSRI